MSKEYSLPSIQNTSIANLVVVASLYTIDYKIAKLSRISTISFRKTFTLETTLQNSDELEA